MCGFAEAPWSDYCNLQSSRSSYYAMDGTRLYHVMYTEILFTHYCTEIHIRKSTVLQDGARMRGFCQVVGKIQASKVS